MRGTGPRATGPGDAFFFGALRGTGPRTTGAGARFFCSAGACLLRSLPHLGHPDNPGHPASDARDIKDLTDLFSVLRLRSIDIQVRWTCSRVLGACRSARACPSPAFNCLKQDSQDGQDEQDGGPLRNAEKRSGRP